MENSVVLNTIGVEIDECSFCGSFSTSLNKHFHSKSEVILFTNSNSKIIFK